MDRAEARALVKAVPGIDFGIVGADVGDGMARGRAGRRRVAGGAGGSGRAWRASSCTSNGAATGRSRSFAGEAARKRARRARGQAHRDADAAARGVEEGPDGRQGVRGGARRRSSTSCTAERRSAGDEQAGRRRRRAATSPTSWCRCGTRSRAIAEVADAAARSWRTTIGRVNLAAAQASTRAAGRGGRADATSASTACEKCHKPAVEFWKKTRARAGVEDAGRRRQAVRLRLHRLPRHRLGEAGRRQPRHRREARRWSTCSARPATARARCTSTRRARGAADHRDASRAERFCADNCHTKEHSDTFAAACPTCATSSARATARRRARRSATGRRGTSCGRRRLRLRAR